MTLRSAQHEGLLQLTTNRQLTPACFADRVQPPLNVTGVKRGKTRASETRLRFGFDSDWLRKWREVCEPIVEANV